MTLDTIKLEHCKFDKARKVLSISSEYIGMPSKFLVKSHHTGKVIEFAAIGPDDSMFDEDHWDGEMMIYRSLVRTPNVEYMVIFNEY